MEGEGEGGGAKEGDEKKGIAEKCHQLFKAGDYEECLLGWFSHKAPRDPCCCVLVLIAGGWTSADGSNFEILTSLAQCEDLSGEVTVRKFKKEDQYACAEHLFRTVRPLRITPPPFPVASPCPPVCIKCVLMPRPVGMQGMTAIGEPESNMYKIVGTVRRSSASDVANFRSLGSRDFLYGTAGEIPQTLEALIEQERIEEEVFREKQRRYDEQVRADILLEKQREDADNKSVVGEDESVTALSRTGSQMTRTDSDQGGQQQQQQQQQHHHHEDHQQQEEQVIEREEVRMERQETKAEKQHQRWKEKDAEEEEHDRKVQLLSSTRLPRLLAARERDMVCAGSAPTPKRFAHGICQKSMTTAATRSSFFRSLRRCSLGVPVPPSI
jgi:hypothetical protein